MGGTSLQWFSIHLISSLANPSTVRKSKIRKTIGKSKSPQSFFTLSFNPGRRQYMELRSLPRAQREETLMRYLSLVPQRPRLKAGSRWRSKRDICQDVVGWWWKVQSSKELKHFNVFRIRWHFCNFLQDVEELHGLGPFGAANFLRVWMRDLAYPRKLQLAWAPTGPRTRAGINLLCRFPSATWPRFWFNLSFYWKRPLLFAKAARNLRPWAWMQILCLLQTSLQNGLVELHVPLPNFACIGFR